MSKLKTGALVAAMEEIHAEYDAKLVFVYLDEAHSADTWPLTCSQGVPQAHRSSHERRAAAEAFLAKNDLLASLVKDHWYLDDMENSLAILNGLWPERYLLLERQEVIWASTLSFEQRFTEVPEAVRKAAASKWRDTMHPPVWHRRSH